MKPLTVNESDREKFLEEFYFGERVTLEESLQSAQGYAHRIENVSEYEQKAVQAICGYTVAYSRRIDSVMSPEEYEDFLELFLRGTKDSASEVMPTATLQFTELFKEIAEIFEHGGIHAEAIPSTLLEYDSIRIPVIHVDLEDPSAVMATLHVISYRQDKKEGCFYKQVSMSRTRLV